MKNQHIYRALMIGCGKMGGALLRQWVNSDQVEFTVIDPANNPLPDGATGFTDKAGIEGQFFDLIIVAIKPQLVDAIMPDYTDFLSPGGSVFSMAAGCSAERLSKAMNSDAIIRVMPNLPSFIGQGVSGIFATQSVTDTHRELAEHLMNLAGNSVWVETEDGIDRITAVAGSGPGYVFEFARVYVEAAMNLGFSREQARDLVLGTIAGTIEMATQSDEPLETLRNNVTSKNGTTEAGLGALNGDDGLSQKLKATVDAAYARAVELR